MQSSRAGTRRRSPAFESDTTLTSQLSLASPPAAWPRWSALRYQLPPGASSLRVTVWRRLRACRAVNLEQGLWAVPHGDDDTVDLVAVVDAVEAAGGRTSLVPIGTEDVDEVELHVRLWRACERIWDDFFTALDRLTIHATGARAVGPDLLFQLDALRAQFGALSGADLVGSDACERARGRLDALCELFAGDGEGGEPRGRPRLEREAGWRRDDGTARYVVVLRPTPSVTWCRRFDAFESATYRPSSRPALSHGAFTFTCRPEHRDQHEASIASRVQLFESTLVG